MTVTRRGLSRLLAATAVGMPAVANAQAAPSPAQGVTPGGITSNDAVLAQAREQARSHARQLAGVRLPMSTEPAFRFRA
jgi:hypothetical protein